MTASLPRDVQQVFDRFLTTEYTTVDSQGQAITWPVTPYYSGGAQTIDVTTALGLPKKAEDARSNPRVALLFSDPTGSGLERPPAVLVQGTAIVDDKDLDSNRERYMRESVEKLPATRALHPPKRVLRMFDWYFARLYVCVRPERVYVWPECDFTREPTLYDSHVEEVRSGHLEEPEVPNAPTTGGPVPWDERLRELGGDRYPTAVVSVVAPDGFPMSARVAVETDEAASRIRLRDVPVGMPLTTGRACLTAHAHAPGLEWMLNFQVRGNLVQEDGRWSIVPRRLVRGFELPASSKLARYRVNARKMMRYRRAARKALKRRRRQSG